MEGPDRKVRTIFAIALRQSGDVLRGECRNLPLPELWQVLLHVSACGVCRIDLRIDEGDLPPRVNADLLSFNHCTSEKIWSRCADTDCFY
jgi:hypothetical protein